MSYLPQYKIGNCDCGCGGIHVEGRKVGKTFMCITSYNKMKTKEQIERQKKRNAIRNASAKISKIEGEDVNKEMSKGYSELDRWFKDRRKEMTGRCEHCSGVSCKHDDKYYKHSIAHLLPKKIFKSVATHPDNWIELCFWNNSCHTNFDNHMIDLIDLNCFDNVINKFAKIYPDIAPEEKRHIPKILIEYLKTEL